MAGGAGPVGGQAVCRDEEPEAGDKGILAGRAVGVFVFPYPSREVPGIDVAEPDRLADSSGPQQGIRGRIIRVGHLIVLVERGDVPGNVRRDR
ncbi:MAG: hypothetical protein V3W33_07515, partial [Gammaproteobacteria bacterium]